MRRFLFLTILLVSGLVCRAKSYTFDCNAGCRKAYQLFMALQAEEAKKILEQEQKNNPDNIFAFYLQDYGDCLQILFNGRPADYVIWKKHSEQLMDLVAQGSDKEPWYRFCKANLYLHRAVINARFGDNFKAATQFRKSLLLLQENKKLFPQFEENKVLLGLEQAVAGAIPDNYKWLGSLFGVSGRISKGVASVVSYLNAHPDGQAPLYDEAAIYYVYLKFYLLSGQEQAWQFVNSSTYRQPDNLMRCFIRANIALNYRKADVALDILRSHSVTQNADQYPIFHYELGEALLARLDYTCINAYEQFINLDQGRYFVKDTWQKMAWVAFLQQDNKRMNYCLQQITKTGNLLTDADKQAQRFAAEHPWPMAALLQVKLLIDGGYTKQALTRIQVIPKESLKTRADQLEYNFRYGRIFEELSNDAKALLFYTATIKDGRNETAYFAARAALQMGFIYERQGNKNAAVTQFQDCLSMRDHDFQSSIDQQAKAGLNRLGE